MMLSVALSLTKLDARKGLTVARPTIPLAAW